MILVQRAGPHSIFLCTLWLGSVSAAPGRCDCNFGTEVSAQSAAGSSFPDNAGERNAAPRWKLAGAKPLAI